MTKIIRTPTLAEGGVTAEELAAMKAHSDLWISRAMRTTPVNADEITQAVKDLERKLTLAIEQLEDVERVLDCYADAEI